MTESQGSRGNGLGMPDQPVRFGIFLWRYRRTIDRELLHQQLVAIRTNDPEGYARVRRFMTTGADGQASSADGAGYERRLDSWRVFITILLVLALFALMIIIILKSINPGTATPYVSLLSGLVGIALGWMFATASQGRQRPPSEPEPPSTAPAVSAPAVSPPAPTPSPPAASAGRPRRGLGRRWRASHQPAIPE